MTDISIPIRRASSLSVRKVLGLVHLWVGFTFSIPFALLGLSGSILMLGRDLPAPVEAPRPAVHSIAEIAAAAKTLAPGKARAVGFEAPAAGNPAAVRFVEPRARGAGGPPQGPGAGIRITVDPVSLEAAPTPPQLSGFMRWVHDLHGRFLVESAPGQGPDLGRTFVGWLGVFMTGLGLSGIVLWWPRPGQWQRSFKVKFDRGLLRAVYDLHRLCGIVDLAVFVVVCVSGVYIVFPQTINTMTAAGPMIRDARQQAPLPVTPAEGETPLDADGVVEIVKFAVPGGVLRTVTMPGNPRQPYRVALARIGDTAGAPMITVAVDPWTKQVIDLRDPATYAANDKMLAWQRALHSGSGAGTVWWVLVFISGLLPPLFAATMWWLRRRVR